MCIFARACGCDRSHHDGSEESPWARQLPAVLAQTGRLQSCCQKELLVSVVKNMTTAAETDRENLIKYLRGGDRVVATTPAQAVAKRDG
jgi:hypothetical protein